MIKEYYIGIMSGTSLDGIDAALVCFEEEIIKTVATHYQPYPDTVKKEALALHTPTHNDLHRTAIFSNVLSKEYAAAVHALLRKTNFSAECITAIGNHGQTLRHSPDLGYTIQAGNGALLAELTNIPVVTDFRSRDIAAGGQGAPLVPAVHAAMFAHPVLHRVILNIGGIANLTNLHPNQEAQGFDCGPGNMLMDAWIQQHSDQNYDKNGIWASSGKVIPSLLTTLRNHPFLALPPPKSCGREQFDLAFLSNTLSGSERPADVQATLTQFTVVSCTDAIKQWCGAPDELFVCGGGAHNQALMACLMAQLPNTSIKLTDALGVSADYLEAIAFAWLAKQNVDRQTGNLPKVTGAHGPRVLGALYPR